MARKPKGSSRAYKEWLRSVKLLQQNINRIINVKNNSRATVNRKIYYKIVIIIEKKNKSKAEIKKNKTNEHL